MALLIPDEGEVKMLSLILDGATAENLTLKLYTNNKTPAEADTPAAYTVASGFGYADKTLTNGSWTVTPGDPSVALYAQQTWTFTGALGDVYGYYVVGAVSGVLYWAERFTTAPFDIQNNGDEIRVTPRITLS
jgi:hypothetical protein